MRSSLLVIIIIATAVTSFAQEAERFPHYYNNKTYTISRALRADDSVGVKKELSRLADSVYSFSKNAGRSINRADTPLRSASAISIAIAAASKGRFQEAYEAVTTVNQLRRPMVTVDIEDMLLELCILSRLPRPGGDMLVDAIRKKVDGLPEYQEKDYMRALKEAAQPDYISKLQQLMKIRLGMVVHADHKQLQYEDVLFLLQSALLKEFLQENRILLEVALYSLDGASVKKNEGTINMRDGVQLRALVFRDINATEKQPAIVCTNLYSGDGETERGDFFGNHGYAYVYVYHRGCSETPGNFIPFENDANDFYDIIDWVSKQPWCNGTIGATGSNYAGYVQWQAIRKQYKHPALKAINPISAIAPGINFPAMGGIFSPSALLSVNYTCNWETGLYRKWNNVLWEMYNSHLPFSELDSLLEMPNPVFQKWLSHPDFDEYWKSLLPAAADYASMDIPVLTITGYADNYQTGAMYYYNNHTAYKGTKAPNNHHLLIGPYSFINREGKVQAKWDAPMEEAAGVPVYKYILEWFDWKLKGKPQPYWIRDQITWFATGAGHWKGATSFQTVTADTLRFYLSTSPVTTEKRRTIYQLQTAPVTATQNLLYRHNIGEAFDSAFLNKAARLPGDSFTIASPYNILFETAPIENEFLLSGRIEADLYLSLNVPDADFVVIVTEVTPDGRTEVIGASPLRCRYRRSADKPVLMTPGQVEKLCFDNGFIYMKKIAKGNRLRLTLTSINSPYFEKNYGFGGVVADESTSGQRYIEATIRMNSEYPSCIKVPVGKW